MGTHTFWPELSSGRDLQHLLKMCETWRDPVWLLTGTKAVPVTTQGRKKDHWVWWQCLFLGPPRPLHPHCAAFLLSGWNHTDLWHPQSSFLSLLCSKNREESIWMSLNQTWITFQPRMGKGPDQPCGAATLESEENGGRRKSYLTI